jgi:hypothetical protein
MTARCVARRRPYLQIAITAGLVALGGVAVAACYSGGGAGTDPPLNALYFPVGLGTSEFGHVLYVANSDFDLQFNGGTIQGYDLGTLRSDARDLIDTNLGLYDGGAAQRGPIYDDGGVAPSILVSGWTPALCSNPPAGPGANGARLPLGQSCAPPINPQRYLKNSVTIGAFATQIQLSHVASDAGSPLCQGSDGVPMPGPRLFTPVRGNASITWADLAADCPDPPADYDRFVIDCRKGSDNRCTTQAGNTIGPHDTRQLTLPGEPFGLALTPDQTAMVVTHQSSTQTSTLLTGLGSGTGSNNGDPSMQFILSGVPNAGSGIVAVPHDDSKHSPAPGCEVADPGQPCVRPAFLETNHSVAEIDLIRYFDDDGSSQQRPFLNREVAYTLTATQGGTDTRGIVIDPSPRIACRYQVAAGDPGPIDPCTDQTMNSKACQQWIACGTVPSRVFIASRSPASLVVGTIGGPSASGDGSFDPDRLTLTDVKPLATGPSNVYLAPIVDSGGNLALRVFIVCFDANQIFVYDPDNQVIENVINVGSGPFAMAFDPFDIRRVATHRPVTGVPSLHDYRFGYVALFTNSYLQVMDLDDSISGVSPYTFENIVFTLGTPTQPKGT